MIKHAVLTTALLFGLALSPFAQAADSSPLIVKNAWLRATPKGATVAGGYVTVTNTGSAPDRMVSASIPLAKTGELHRMSMENGVMHMSRLAEGLVIAAGATIILTPGGDHLMFLQPAAPFKEHETVQGSLTFEKAGTIPVTFTVAGMAAKVAPGSMEVMHDMGMMHEGMDMKGH